ncbi:hypothetical protein Tco_0026045 [Tanacetum coccineum]
MAYLVANNTLTSTRSSVMENCVSLESMGAIVGVGVTVVIVAVGVVVAAGVVVEEVVTYHCWAYAYPPRSKVDKANCSFRTIKVERLTVDELFIVYRFNIGVPVGPVFLLGLLAFAIVAACASRAAVTLSATSFLMAV